MKVLLISFDEFLGKKQLSFETVIIGATALIIIWV